MAIRCPRCGYELHGIVASWSTACPLRASCAECGLDFDWADLLSTSRRLAPWCVEYALRWWNIPGRSLKTLLMMLRPWRFWSELKMTHRPRWGRVIGMFAIILVMVYALFAVTIGSRVAIYIRRAQVTFAETAFTSVYAAAFPFSEYPPSPYDLTIISPPLHYTREFAWDRGWDRARLDEVRYTLLTGRKSGIRLRRPAFGSVIAIELVAMLTVLTAPLGFMVLPASRRRAKVLWWHVCRITLYSLVIVPVVYAGFFVRYVLGGSHWALPTTILVEVWHVMVWGVPIALIVWWSFAIDRYLRMPHALGVAVSLVVLGMLIGPALFTLLMSVGLSL